MGSGTSRGKRVAPACAAEARVTKAGGAGARGPFNQHKVHCAQPESRSEGPHSDDDADGPGAAVRKTSPRRAFIRSKTYGLCPFSGGDTKDEMSCSPQLEKPRVPRSASRDVNNRSNCVFTPRKQQRHATTKRFPAGGTFLESVPTCDKQRTSGSCHSPSLPMPVILYDGSEEELMDTIEREFS